MGEITKFQQMNGCSACKHIANTDDAGVSAATHGKSFWCGKMKKAVDSRDGSACADWEYAA